jgi:ABC-type cobalamin transport system ATPase subunit
VLSTSCPESSRNWSGKKLSIDREKPRKKKNLSGGEWNRNRKPERNSRKTTELEKCSNNVFGGLIVCVE